MKRTLLDEEMMINRPIRCARSEQLVQTGERGNFNTSGWSVTGKVVNLLCDKKDMKSGFYVYEITDIDFLTFNGLELTEKEETLRLKMEAKGSNYIYRV